MEKCPWLFVVGLEGKRGGFVAVLFAACSIELSGASSSKQSESAVEADETAFYLKQPKRSKQHLAGAK